MRFGSLCSGIDAASVAWNPLGWKAAWFSEIDNFASTVLRARYPDVPNLGDMTAMDFCERAAANGAIDVLVGGTPCQSFSIQGLRGGLDDARGNLCLRFVQIVRDLNPRWIVWENVVGVLSSNGGRDFGTFLGALAKLGYGWAYRVLDAQHFGVAQRRQRVFLVGCFGDWRQPAGVLFDSQACATNAQTPATARSQRESRNRGASRRVFGWTGDTTPKFGIDVVPTLKAYQGGEGVGILSGDEFRRLTAREWERLMGMPDDYTQVSFNGKPASESARRTAIGNSFCVPVVKWIGERIHFMEEEFNGERG